MKQRTVFALALMLCLAFSGCALLAACGNQKDGLQTLCDIAGLALKNARIISDDDSHGSFHGDGVRLAVVRFDALADVSVFESADGWSPLPLRDDLAELLYEGMNGVWPSETRIPQIEDGYWYFLDRCPPQHPDYDKPFSARGSYNFTAALYDAAAQTLYYCEMDT